MRYLLLCVCVCCNCWLLAQPEAYVCPPCGSRCDQLVHTDPGTCDHCGMTLVSATELTEDTSPTIAFYLQPGVEVLDFAGPLEVFSYAGFRIFTVSLTQEPIYSQGVLKVVPDYDITTAPAADILAFFGGNSGQAFDDPRLIEWIAAQSPDYHFSVCTGAFALAKAGVLDGHSATTFHRALDGLERGYPQVTVLRDARFVDNGRVITTAGISAGIDGALHLVAKLQGLEAARRIAANMEYDKWVPGEGVILTDDSPYGQE